jgi:glycosyltransferase involved in cell wall biosynthesis
MNGPVEGASPLVSVVIPAYNEEAALPGCLETLGRQTYPNLEIIIVDDGSTDRSREVAREFPVRLLEGQHLGPAAARNRGAREAKGELLVFVDADMQFDPAFVEKLTEPVRRGEALGTFTIEEFVANPENRWARCWSFNLGFSADSRHAADHPPHSSIFRALPRARFLEVGGYTEGVGYSDDDTLADKLGGRSTAAPGRRAGSVGTRATPGARYTTSCTRLPSPCCAASGSACAGGSRPFRSSRWSMTWASCRGWSPV